MAFSDGDPFVSGSLLSFQQGNRMIQNYRGATVPSNLQAGALWSDSDDNRVWHQGTTLDEVFTEQTTLTWENLLSNSGFGYWSRSDASKGLATITYDQGAKGAGAAPSVGDAVVGGTSGATAKVISYTILTGAFATDDATGVVTVGAVSHDFAFVDNETITFGGVETAVVNMPDSAVQVGLVQNGGFAAATTGWTPTDCTVASVAGGEVGNCLQLTRTGGTKQLAEQAVTLEVGKIYKYSVWVESGTSGNEAFYISVYKNGVGAQADLHGTSSAAWVQYTITFEAVQTGYTLIVYKNTATAGTMLFDEITCYEITPCVTSGTNAFDGWNKDAGIDIYRQHNDGGTLTHDGSFYSLKLVPITADHWVYTPSSTVGALGWHVQKFAGRTVTAGCWAKTSTATHFRISIYDGSHNYSSYHTGGGDWEWIQVTATLSATATDVRFFFTPKVAGAVDGSTIVYISHDMLVFGSHIGEGNYQPKPNDFIFGEVPISSNAYHAKGGLSDLAFTDLNIEADSDAKIPKGIKAIFVHTGLHDVGSAAAAHVGLELRSNSTFSTMSYTNIVSGKANDLESHITGKQGCDANGDVDIKLSASGAGDLDIDMFQYHGALLN